MRIERWTGTLVPLVAALILSACGAGTANLRADNGGHLADCNAGPHCVSSTATDASRRVAPLDYTGMRAQARRRLLRVIGAMGGRVVEQEPDYLHATFTSVVFRFVDDVEFVLPADSHEIQLRSSSRIGYYDFGVNRARVEEIRRHFEDATG